MGKLLLNRSTFSVCLHSTGEQLVVKMALAEDRGFSLSRFFISLLSLLVVLSSFFHRLCDAQTEVSFDCTTLQPTGIEDAFMGSDNSDYTVTVDQPYFQQGSIRRGK